MEYVIFEKDWLDVPIQDYPVGGLAVCYDPKKRLGEKTWAVLQIIGDDGVNALGLFWDRPNAIQFAQSFA